jgi:glycosyltransferase involved in cell wall biosynthesis
VRRILLASNHLVQPGGSETWTLTVAAELIRREYEVVVYSPQVGPFAEAFPCRVVGEVRGKFDLGLVNHNTCIEVARSACRKVIMTCHGTFPPLEQPVSGADRYVAISEEVLAHLKSLGYDATVIWNPIDCEIFSPTRPRSQRQRTPYRTLRAQRVDSTHN